MTQPGPLSILRHFGSLADPRVKRTRKHELQDVLVIALCAVLGDADSWDDIQEFGEAHKAWFQRFLALPNGIPSHDTFNRVFSALDPQAFQGCFTSWINAICDRLGLTRYQVDGKAARGSADRGKGLACLHTVSVWADEAGLSLAQQKVDGKSNEITAIPKLLELLDLRGALVSIDAIGCQKAIAGQVLDQGGDYLLAVKENQPTLHRDAQALLERGLEEDLAGPHITVCGGAEEAGHGRQESRSYTLFTDLSGLSTKGEWPGLKAVLVAARERRAGGQVSHELAFYVSSSAAGVEALAAAVRAHWDIENGCHWVLDVTFKEDQSRARAGNAQENLCWLRRVALSLLKRDDSKGSLKGKRKRAGWNTAFLEHLLGLLSDE